MKKLILLMALVMTNHAYAERWVNLSAGKTSSDSIDEKISIQIDASSIRERNGMRQAWWRQNFFPVRPGTTPAHNIGSILFLHLFDCKNAEAAIFESVLFTRQFSAGDESFGVKLSRGEALKIMRSALPGSIGEDVLAYVCAYPLQLSTK